MLSVVLHTYCIAEAEIERRKKYIIHQQDDDHDDMSERNKQITHTHTINSRSWGEVNE